MLGRKQFSKWMARFSSLSPKLRKDLELELIKKANQYCQREGLKSNEFVVTSIKVDDIVFGFVVAIR